MANELKIESVVADTGILYALADRNDSWHERSAGFIDNYKGRIVVPCSVLPETCYLLNNHLSAFAERVFLESACRKEFTVEHLTVKDFIRCKELLEKYKDLNIGFADATIAAVAERLSIRKILTTDRKHFSAIKPGHCKAWELLP